VGFETAVFPEHYRSYGFASHWRDFSPPDREKPYPLDKEGSRAATAITGTERTGFCSGSLRN
jgi:hypothetical protein